MSDETQLPDTKPTPAEIARANAAKSTGPKTPEGKARSSKNALRHGLTARRAVLPDESEPKYLALRRRYVDHFRPSNIVEVHLVGVMALTQWRINRLATVETSYLARELESRRDDIRRYVDNPDAEKSMAWTFDRVSGGTTLPLIHRFEASLHRTFNRAFKQLQDLRDKANNDKNKNIRKRSSQPLQLPSDLNADI
jgi:hypothetical protein